MSQNSNHFNPLSHSTSRDSIEASAEERSNPHHPLPTANNAPDDRQPPQPIAIIGIGCRFPGRANSPQAFWELLRDGVDAITEVPPDRFSLRQFYDPDPNKAGKTASRWGGFIENIDQFDPQFFGISPREANRIDPQQRLLLEVSWEALEDGGLVAEKLAGSRTGVFIGLSSHDYADIQSRISERDAIDPYMGPGSAMSIAANRISYTFDFMGPSVAIDTACSSALVAITMACQSIRNGECTLALAGGVNAILKPEVTIGFSKASMLSRDGRCKSFDAQADGFVRAEGAGVVILKPFSKAVADGDPIYALIRGSAINQDGHTTGITVPSGAAQEAMLREAYQKAGVAPHLVQYVEAHGTGTALGDPIEAKALGAVLGQDRPPPFPPQRWGGKECLIGSVKSNIGHLEAGAGIAGIIKVALALKHGQIPPTLHFERPNPKIPFDDLRLRVVDTLLPWPATNQRVRFAGVNSFGFGGTNAHIVLQEAPPDASGRGSPIRHIMPCGYQPPSQLLPLSARSPEALRAMAQAHLDFLTTPDSQSLLNHGLEIPLADICYTATVRRSHHNHRLAFVAHSKAEMIEQLAAYLAGTHRWGIAAGRLSPAHSPKPVFVFSGMGPQWWGMGRQLLAEEPVFSQMIKDCDSLLQPLAGWSLWEALTADETASRINETQIAQPAIFALQVALAALWRSWGIEPAAIVGHSVGEVAASHVAGILSLEDAMQVIYHRSRLQARLAGLGTMLAVGLSAPEVERYIKGIKGYQERVSEAQQFATGSVPFVRKRPSPRPSPNLGRGPSPRPSPNLGRGRKLPFISPGGVKAGPGVKARPTRLRRKERSDLASIAAINSPRSVTLAGEREALAEIATALENEATRTEKEIFCRFLRVEVPYHSPLMERIQDELVAAIINIKPQPATTPFYSTVTGNRLAGPELGAEYWGLNVRQPVQFAAALNELMQADHELFLEISAHPVLASSILHCLAAAGREGHTLPSLRRPAPASGSAGSAASAGSASFASPTSLNKPCPEERGITAYSTGGENGRARMLASLGKLYTLGYPIEWQRVYPTGQFIPLPTYQWQRERYWHESESSRLDRVADVPFRTSEMLGQQVHPLLGSRLKSPHPLWDGQIDRQQLTYLNDHRLQGVVVYPAAAYLEMALAAGQEFFKESPCVIEDIVFEKALFLPESATPTLQFILEPGRGTKPTTFEIYSRLVTNDARPVTAGASGGGEKWVRHATGELRIAAFPDKASVGLRPSPNPQIFPDELDGPAYYRQLLQKGVEYGPTFQGIERLYHGQGEALGKLRLVHHDPDIARYQLHPTILDACFQVLFGTLVLPEISQAQQLYLPVQIERILLSDSWAKRGERHPVTDGERHPVTDGERRPSFGTTGPFTSTRKGEIEALDPGPESEANDTLPSERAGELWAYARLVQQSATHLTGDIELLDEAGKLLVEIKGLRCQAVGGATLSSKDKLDQYLYQYEWELQPHPEQNLIGRPVDYMPSPAQLAAPLMTEATQLSKDLAREAYYTQIEGQVDLLCTAYLINAFQQLGWQFTLGQPLSAETLFSQLKILPEHRRLLERMLEMLHEEGILKRVDDGSSYEVCQLPELPAKDTHWRGLISQYPAYQAELILLRRCGLQLAQVLQGETDPRQLIFPQGSMSLAEHLYRDSPTSRIYNILTQKAIRQALADLPEGRTVRILEIGAGTGATSAYVLPILPRERTEYVFTDISPLFISHAEQKFGHYPFIQYRLLDIEQEPSQQGFQPHSFDLIIAADVIHATSDLRHTLSHVKQLLAQGGLLLLVEGTNLPRWVDLVFGLLKGWWLFTDFDLRPKHPLLSWPQWQGLLRKTGFSEVVGVAEIEQIEKAKQTIILANVEANPCNSPTVRANPCASPSPSPPSSPPSQGPSQSWDRRKKKEIEQGLREKEGDRAKEGAAWLLFADGQGVAERLAQLLKERGQRVLLVWPNKKFKRLDEAGEKFEIRPSEAKDYQELLHSLGTPLRAIVYCWSLDIPKELKEATLELAMKLGPLAVTYLVQALDAIKTKESPRLYLVNGGSQPRSDRAAPEQQMPISVAEAPIWAFGRTLIREFPHLRGTMIDLSQGVKASSEVELKALCHELLLDSREDEVALRGAARYVHRLKPISQLNPGPPQPSSPFQLEITTPGILDALTFRAFQRHQPAPREVEIEVYATALNFKDVAKAMGILDDLTLEGTGSLRAVGMECAGKISAIGENVEGLAIGDGVIAFAPHSFASHAYANARFVVHKPAHLTFEESTTITLVFITVHYALNYLARIRAGDRILIHAASGGVGLAAVQLAQQAGAEIFATAGSPEKREFLRALGIEHVYDSRSLAFASQIMEETDGQGVDIVLNSLTGEALSKSLALLAPYGRFIELGKRDIEQNNRLGLRPFQNNLSFFAIDLDRLYVERPDLASTLLHEVLQFFLDKTFHPLPHRVFPISEVVSAFRYMAQAKHIGKVVISLRAVPEGSVPVRPQVEGCALSESAGQAKITWRPDGTYLLTGGLGGLGLAVARWMVEHGATHLVLMGRSGASTPAAKKAVAELRASGAQVVVAKADVTQKEEVASTLAKIRQTMPPLRGIIHGAMVLDDALVLQLTQERFQKVWGPKVIGAYHLHKQTLKMPLDFFIMFSSFTSLVGNPGQGNYVAASGFLDALAHYRRAKGLPALTINWGAVAEVGYVAERAEVSQHLQRMGANPLPLSIALDALGQLMQRGATQTAVLSANWQRMAAGSSPKFSALIGGDKGGAPKAGGTAPCNGDSLRDKMRAELPAERQHKLETMLREQVGRVLGTSPAKVEIEQPLTNLGLDSLMALELRNRIKSDLEIDVPTMKLLEGPNIGQLATFLNQELGEVASLPPSDPSPAPSQIDQGLVEGLKSASIASEPSTIRDVSHTEAPSDELDSKLHQLKAGQLLAQLDELGDQEVDELLVALLSEQ